MVEEEGTCMGGSYRLSAYVPLQAASHPDSCLLVSFGLSLAIDGGPRSQGEDFLC